MVGSTRPDLRLQERLALMAAHLVVALVALVVIGGATRVMEAGLACPDWPLCYGRFLPGQQMNLQVFLEWFHRLDAFVVGVALLVLTGVSALWRQSLPRWLPWVAAGSLLLVAVQGALGALTVSQLLAAPLVTAHLATALLLVALVSGLYQRLALAGAETESSSGPAPRWWQALAFGSLLLVVGQCVLGGSMASQWAAQQCLSSGDGCRWLLAHRQGAAPAAAAVATLALSSLLLPAHQSQGRGLALGALALVVAQVALGVAVLRHQLMLPGITIAHQLVAALLVALLASALARSYGRPQANLEWAHG
ncbi:COX15/CtaA family protein [Cyanobium sp. HWJ4-Hawea]|uniref:COX15/CtaA family protein n=1 Tax=Cyanobium sp. HWJ4-Hawea TaxID=2823713 RepID=UPI0020CF8536|nr:COX15/CtaA family protein [Cyanobium sp. HWJ4-Hawea]MCP9807838.1 COX15/CtaA family protein [Cyanobium sp. HWJ4-Hawea]